MIKVNIRKKDNIVYEIMIKGHSEYDTFGKDIVCAAVSSISITTINGINSIDDSIDYEENQGLLKIKVKEVTDINQKLLNNMIEEFSELVSQYPKNIEIRNED